MAEFYLSSSDIDVFPSVNRATTQVSARLLSEMRIASLITLLVDNNAFVISYDATNYTMEINIKGYYFKIKSVNSLLLLFDSNDTIYAIIELSENPVESPSANTVEYIQLLGLDDGGYYKGITFSDSMNSGENYYNLKIFEKSSGVWMVPETSYVKINSRSVEVYEVDGGVIE